MIVRGHDDVDARHVARELRGVGRADVRNDVTMSASFCSSERKGWTCAAGPNVSPATLVAFTIVFPSGLVTPRMPTFVMPRSFTT